ncbi:hypothetical protein DdX_09189 [Ditylenchus destructor]|uniref:Uncharacterized protein n=1 Tax=Ditylenchus destructor TaxID=166010 RepID=A0AAD4N2V8_9BILA|nr:hypothetical protein DdX_09189 [Ditylenchus destructor]
MCLAVAVNGCSTDAECSDGKVCIDHSPDAAPTSCGDPELAFDCKKNDDCPSGYICAFVNDFLQQRCGKCASSERLN